MGIHKRKEMSTRMEIRIQQIIEEDLLENTKRQIMNTEEQKELSLERVQQIKESIKFTNINSKKITRQIIKEFNLQNIN